MMGQFDIFSFFFFCFRIVSPISQSNNLFYLEMVTHNCINFELNYFID